MPLYRPLQVSMLCMLIMLCTMVQSHSIRTFNYVTTPLSYILSIAYAIYVKYEPKSTFKHHKVMYVSI